MTDDRFLFDHTPDPTLPVAPSVLALRAALAEATRDHLAVPDAALERDWPWSGHSADVRYGLYRSFEAIETAGVEAARVLRDTNADRKSTRLNSSHIQKSRMPSSA